MRLPTGGLVGEGFGGEQLIHYRQLAVGGVVGVGEAASRDQRRAHGFEVARNDADVIHRLKLAGVGEGGGQTPSDREEGPGEREGGGRGDALHAGQRVELASEIADPGGTLRRLYAAASADGKEGEQVAGIETGIDAL